MHRRVLLIVLAVPIVLLLCTIGAIWVVKTPVPAQLMPVGQGCVSALGIDCVDPCHLTARQWRRLSLLVPVFALGFAAFAVAFAWSTKYVKRAWVRAIFFALGWGGAALSASGAFYFALPLALAHVRAEREIADCVQKATSPSGLRR